MYESVLLLTKASVYDKIMSMSIDQFPNNPKESQINSSEQAPSSEQMAALRNSLDNLFGQLKPRRVEECGNGFTIKNYDVTAPSSGRFVHISAAMLHHDTASNPIQRIYVSVGRGSEEVGPDMFDDFKCTIQDTASLDGQKIEIRDDGIAIVEPREAIHYMDNAAIDARREEILEDKKFDSISSRGVVLPNLQLTPSGEIYQDGVEVADNFSPKSLPELAISSSFMFNTDEEAAEFQRSVAASEQARREIGTDLTSERIKKLTYFLDELGYEVGG